MNQLQLYFEIFFFIFGYFIQLIINVHVQFIIDVKSIARLIFTYALFPFLICFTYLQQFYYKHVLTSDHFYFILSLQFLF